jgi:transcriptional regulator with XRE-family HTH domain
MSEIRKAKRRVAVSPGESVRIIREMQELSQNQVAELAGMPQSTVSAIQRGRVNPGVDCAKTLARV